MQKITVFYVITPIDFSPQDRDETISTKGMAISADGLIMDGDDPEAIESFGKRITEFVNASAEEDMKADISVGHVVLDEDDFAAFVAPGNIIGLDTGDFIIASLSNPAAMEVLKKNDWIVPV